MEPFQACRPEIDARTFLGWKPTVTFEGLVEMMTKADLALAARGAA